MALEPGQYPAPALNGLPSITLGLPYWHAETGEWWRSELQRPTQHEEWPLQPFERDVVSRMLDRDSVYLVHQAHFYRPPVLDDAAEISDFLAHADTWRSELLAGRIVAWQVQPARLLAASRATEPPHRPRPGCPP
jgi:hypothetical protein